VSCWPKLYESEEGKKRRVEDQEASRLAREKQLKEDFFDSPSSLKPIPRLPSPTTSIHTEASTLTNISHLAGHLQLSSSSSIDLACTLADTRAVRDRAASTLNLISERLKILDRLIAKYDGILVSMEAGESSGQSSSHPKFVEGSSKDAGIVEGVLPVAQTASERDVEMELLKG
jgi:hypothetical protein